jgi:hypothetical protein
MASLLVPNAAPFAQRRRVQCLGTFAAKTLNCAPLLSAVLLRLSCLFQSISTSLCDCLRFFRAVRCSSLLLALPSRRNPFELSAILPQWSHQNFDRTFCAIHTDRTQDPYVWPVQLTVLHRPVWLACVTRVWFERAGETCGPRFASRPPPRVFIDIPISSCERVVLMMVDALVQSVWHNSQDLRRKLRKTEH